MWKSNKIITLQTPTEVKELCKTYADGLDQNRHTGRMVGHWHDLYRGCLGQEMFHRWLLDTGIEHEYMKPYHEDGHPTNEFDIKIADEEYEVKTRSRWNRTYSYNIKLYMGAHENSPKFKPDYYVFCTTDTDANYLFILGGIEYHNLWNGLHEPEDKEFLFPPAGYILSRELIDLHKLIFRI